MASTENLIELWLEVETSMPGVRAADALRGLNDEVGTGYTHSHLSRWRRGISRPGPAAQDYMRRVVIEAALYRALGEAPRTYTDEQMDRLAALLSLPAA